MAWATQAWVEAGARLRHSEGLAAGAPGHALRALPTWPEDSRGLGFAPRETVVRVWGARASIVDLTLSLDASMSAVKKHPGRSF